VNDGDLVLAGSQALSCNGTGAVDWLAFTLRESSVKVVPLPRILGKGYDWYLK
jgi:hypothetical protein